ncbi:hypothetical protein TrRE_jg4904 [Triparma retinervis]|uniref:Peptidase A1 domain-containing protein n=1 Tax=Triparma retinervis TaxID=2557542 RepID=A0A9W7DRJ9_9STRA|nr:hypothetical protein TrRE_jg4904 [Triparma retinervis]
MGSPFDVSASSTSTYRSCLDCADPTRADCRDGLCVLSQRYAEGSSWVASQVSDVADLGGKEARVTFGCHVEETGMFLKQRTDGIMGLAMHKDGIVAALTAGEPGSGGGRAAFALCFTPTGGLMKIFPPPLFPEANKFGDKADLRDMEGGYYSIAVTAVRLGGSALTGAARTLAAFNRNNGVVLDSGTTDTYLPKAVKGDFEGAWRRETGWEHGNEPRAIGSEEFEMLPDLVFTFEGGGEMAISPSSYMDSTDNPFGVYTSRVYLEEPSGAILGSNAFMYREILFHGEEGRVGWRDVDDCYGGG